MIKGKINFLLALICVFQNYSFGQKLSVSNYVIVTIEDSFQISLHDIQKYYWIIPVDSIQTSNVTFYPLFLFGIIKNDLVDCCNDKAIDPNVYKPSDTLKYLDNQYDEEIIQLNRILSVNKKAIQRNKKDFIVKGNKEYVTYYATPIKGYFCSCEYALTGQWRTGYKGKVFVPYSSFEFDKGFWKSEKAKVLIQQDFSKILFDIIR